MRLSKLQMQGFKSFADSTTMTFDSGVTAIVGPNGCGKSNVSDAVRWVLGEQRARILRGSKMEEVIFQGSSARRAVNLAEVSLVFENEDGGLPIAFKEVVITRRLSRSGESDYLLNGAPCRLRDIHDLQHVVCGYGRDTLGELCLLSFMVTQTPNRGIAFIIFMARRKARRATTLFSVDDCIDEGRRIGEAAKWFAAVNWETRLAEPLEQLRRELGVRKPTLYRDALRSIGAANSAS